MDKWVNDMYGLVNERTGYSVDYCASEKAYYVRNPHGKTVSVAFTKLEEAKAICNLLAEGSP